MSARRRVVTLLAVVVALVAGLLTAVVPAQAAQATTAPAAVLRAPGVLAGGHELVSPNGNFRVLMGRNGDLLLLNRWQRVMWSSRTAGNRGARLLLGANGNLVLRARSGKALWAAKTRGRHAVLELRNSGALVLVAHRHMLWYTRTAIRYGAHDNPYPAASLATGHSLTAGHQLRSAHGGYRAVMGGNGEFAITGPAGTLWSTGTGGATGARLTLASNGNLVLYAAAGGALWQSRTRAHGGLLVLADNGNLVIYDARGRALWQSRTTPPTASTSHYIRSAAGLTATGCADARSNGIRRSVVVLHIGAQFSDLGAAKDEWGVQLSATSTTLTDAELVPLLQQYITGYGDCMAPTGKLLLAVATNNDSGQDSAPSSDVCPTSRSARPDPLGAPGGAEWADAVITPLTSYAAPWPGVSMAGANDIEPSAVGCESQAESWINAFLGASTAPYVFIGSADGCPSSLGSTEACLAGWTQRQIYDLAYGLDAARSIPLPQIYTPGMAVQWANIAGAGGAPLRFGGVLTEQAACAEAGCPTLPGSTSLNSPTAWNELSTQLTLATGTWTSAGAYTTDLRVN